MPDVVCMGEVLVELVSCQKNTPLSRVSHFESVAGGAPANVAVGIQKLCGKAAFCGCVGSDVFGKKLQETFKDAGVDTTFLHHHPTEPTTLVFTAVWDDGHKELCFYRGADKCVDPENITDSLFRETRCFHYGSITLIDSPGADAQRKAMKMARDMGLFVTYDPNYRPTLWPNEETAQRTMLDAFQYAHMAKISVEEFPIVTGHEDLESGIRAVLNRGVELLIVSKGDQGAMAINGDYTVESPALTDISIVETTGAGDGFMAAMITRMLPVFEAHGGSLKTVDKETVQAALDYANVVGGLTCTKAGAIPALPTKQEVDAFIMKRRSRQPSPTTTTSMSSSSAKELAAMIDHTFLKPHCVQPGDIEKLCREARDYSFAVVCVNPSEVEECVRLLQGSSVHVGAAIGFPLGQTTSAVKAFETRDAIQRGATEIDMVINVRELQGGNYELVRSEVETVVQICREHHGVLCKFILETCYLTDEQKTKACEICRDAGADFVKTSTGFGPAGATVDDVKLMRQTVGNAVGVKASGGIRDLATARAMVDAGATRIGTSSGVGIIEEFLKEAE